ncbi:MAG TPA: ATP-binding cassette domain-containing protein [Steroidobacteraceae bacterium]|nr:ATP-binding cassette domain-containing protein [Steroidobacteraceae bacterium]
MIRTERLTRRYDTLTAVDEVSFEAQPGEVLGFLGPNGAGKTTTMRMIAGFIAPTEGRASICGHDIEREPLAAKRALGYLPEGAPSYGEMSVKAFLEFIADLRGLAGATRRSRLDHVIARLALQDVTAQSIDTLSKGFRRRVGIAQAILHDPPVLILDEPTDGLDPNQKHEVRALINEMAAEKTIVVSTHILEEVEAVCTRAIIIARGRIVADDTPQGLTARSRYHNAVSLQLADAAEYARAQAALAALPQVASVEADERELRLTALPQPGARILTAVTDLANRQSLGLKSLALESGRLDEVFRSITV